MLVIFTLTNEEMQTKNATIENLLGRIARGETAAMGGLYDVIKTDVFAYALSKTANRQDADDIMQDTFVQIYKYAKQYKPQGKPMAWIITIELNLIRRLFQVKSRSVSFDAAFENTPIKTDYEQRTVNNIFLKELVNKLSEDEREVVTLHIVSGMKHREIAKMLQKPLSTVLSKYNRAIKKLQCIVKESK